MQERHVFPILFFGQVCSPRSFVSRDRRCSTQESQLCPYLSVFSAGSPTSRHGLQWPQTRPAGKPASPLCSLVQSNTEVSRHCSHFVQKSWLHPSCSVPSAIPLTWSTASWKESFAPLALSFGMVCLPGGMFPGIQATLCSLARSISPVLFFGQICSPRAKFSGSVATKHRRPSCGFQDLRPSLQERLPHPTNCAF